MKRTQVHQILSETFDVKNKIHKNDLESLHLCTREWLVCKSHRIRWPEVMVKNGGIHFEGVKFDIKLKLIPSISFWQPELNPDFFFSWRL